MKNYKKLIIAIPILFLIYGGNFLYQKLEKEKSEDAVVWEEDIAALESKLEETPAKEGSILFLGSSSIRLWGSIAEDMKPFDVVQRGFGGAKFLDVVYYADRLLEIGSNPGAIVVFVGTNDIHPGSVKSPATLLKRYQQFIDVVRAKYIDTPVYYIAITPSVMRWDVWNTAVETNRLIADYSSSGNNLFVIDMQAEFLGADGTPNSDFYRFDGLHLNKEGYARWTKVIMSRMLADLR